MCGLSTGVPVSTRVCSIFSGITDGWMGVGRAVGTGLAMRLVAFWSTSSTFAPMERLGGKGVGVVAWRVSPVERVSVIWVPWPCGNGVMAVTTAGGNGADVASNTLSGEESVSTSGLGGLGGADVCVNETELSILRRIYGKYVAYVEWCHVNVYTRAAAWGAGGVLARC